MANKIQFLATKDARVNSGDTFRNIILKDKQLRNIFSCGFEKPSPIQQRSIELVLKGRDVMAQIESNTGKTAMCCISILQNLDTTIKETQVLCLCPSRTLAEEMEKAVFAVDNKIRCRACTGGCSTMEDIRQLQSGQHVVLATPGRMLEMIQKKVLHIKFLKAVILSEADDTFSRGFERHMYELFHYLPTFIQVVLISATLPEKVLEFTSKFMKKPICISVKRNELTLEGITQFFAPVEKEEDKFQTISDLYDGTTMTKCAIFCNTKIKVSWLTEKMRQAGLLVNALHSDMNQKERIRVLRDFKSGKCNTLVTTDLWARCIIAHIYVVINYDIPYNPDLYILRIGRSEGTVYSVRRVINLVIRDEIDMVKEMEEYYGTEINPMPIVMT